MDKSKVDKLFQALGDLDEEISEGLQSPLLHVRDTDWQSVLPELGEDCNATIDKLDEAMKVFDNLRRKAVRTQRAIAEIHELYGEVQGRVVPKTVGESIKAIVGGYLAQGTDVILVGDVQKQIVDSGIVLKVKNPAAVIASILARDERLEKISMGRFRRRIPKESEQKTAKA